MKFLAATSAIGILLFSVLTNALPNPAALPDALAEDGAEIVAREALIGVSSDQHKLAARGHGYCWVGWDQTGFKGNSKEACCNYIYSCCSFDDDLLSRNLISAKATESTSGGVRLWTSNSCTGESRWVDFEGWGNLRSAPAYYSFSLN